MNIPTNDIYSLSNRIIKQQQDMMKQSIYRKEPKNTPCNHTQKNEF